MATYECKIANLDEIIKKYNYEIDKASDKYNWEIWKQKAIDRFNNHEVITYIGVLDGEIISEASAAIDSSIDVVHNPDNLINDKTAYLFAFRTNKEHIGKGYFSKLFNYMIDDLKSKGYESVTLGVEPEELKNKAIYQKYGFTNFIRFDEESYPDGTVIKVEYYSKTL